MEVQCSASLHKKLMHGSAARVMVLLMERVMFWIGDKPCIKMG